MKTYELLEIVIAALKTDAALATYARAQYDRAPQIYDSYAGDFPPGPDECPYILVHSPGKSANRERQTVPYGLQVDYYVYDETDQVRADGAELSSGSIRLLTLQELGRQAILAALPATLTMAYQEESETAELWPFLPATTAFDFTERLRIGQDPLEQED